MPIDIDVDIAVAIPVNVLPLLDDGDFKTRETSVAYNAAGMDLVWNFVTTGGVMTQTAVTPTTAGDYDWSHVGDGMYKIEIPASGGASINNNSEGAGWFSGVATGVLPWVSPVYRFRAAGLNDLLIDSAYSTTRGLAGTALPAVAAEAAGGLFTRGTGAGQINQAANGMIDTNPVRLNNVSQSLLDLKDFADDGYDPSTNKVTGVVLVDTLTTYTGNTVQTGDSFARIGATGSGLTSLAPSATALSTAQWTNTRAGYLDNINNVTLAGAVFPSDPADQSLVIAATDALASLITTVDTVVDAIKAKTDNLPSDPADASVIAGRFDTLDTSVADLPTNAELATALGTADDATLAAIAALNNLSAAQVNAEVDTALADYDGPTNAEMVARTLVAADYATAAALASLVTTVGAAGAGLTEAGGTGDHLTAIPKTGYELASTGLDLVLVAGVNVPEALRRIGAITAGEISGAGTGTETFLDWAESAASIVITVDLAGNRTSVVFN